MSDLPIDYLIIIVKGIVFFVSIMLSASFILDTIYEGAKYSKEKDRALMTVVISWTVFYIINII